MYRDTLLLGRVASEEIPTTAIVFASRRIVSIASGSLICNWIPLCWSARLLRTDRSITHQLLKFATDEFGNASLLDAVLLRVEARHDRYLSRSRCKKHFSGVKQSLDW